MASMKVSSYFTELTAFHAFVGNYVITVFVSAIATLAFETPITLLMERTIFDEKVNPSIEVQTNAQNEGSNESTETRVT